ncbi:MAG: bifunctional phosphoribosylaminoimidazolecarboxamide formyltransferase/inosine monophosphate cyclohydrolase [Spirochaetes bacterium]|nr:MAG: bifunctional phosphoribosylaminoimidazolecarboxamide formyltransferase/inosine monophosphate cyclohydrolase [Spirochaetota bacterium]
MKRALLSVYNKKGIAEFADFLERRGIELLSTGGTFRHLKERGIPVTEVSEMTGFPEILDGRVKTLHPKVHGGLLARRDNREDMDTIEREGIIPIDILVVNLYPFFEKYKSDLSFEEKLEFIDIGGPTMLRAAAKNFKDVVVISDPDDYRGVRERLEASDNVDFAYRKHLAGKVFNLMSSYDAAVSAFLLEDGLPLFLRGSFEKTKDLRYGENPHQKSAFYSSLLGEGGMNSFVQLHGKDLSYNNYRDMDSAWKVVCEFEETACCGLKHNTPCGAAVAETVFEAYTRAYEGDPVSIFGGIVAFNRTVDAKTAEKMSGIFLEVVIAPDFNEDALEILKSRKNIRLIKAGAQPSDYTEMVTVDGGILVQERDVLTADKLEVVTAVSVTEKQREDLLFGEKICRYVKSNAIIVVKDKQVLGVGSGQVNRIWAAEQALQRAAEKGIKEAVLVSDAFMPFKDVAEEAVKYGIAAILQPGGSLRDKDSIEVCNNAGIPMVFSGLRHFKH